MPKIPGTVASVPLETATLSTPVAPTITTPRTVTAAFGADVGRATQFLGDVGQRISEHLEQLALDDMNKKVIERETAYKQDVQNRQSNQELETVKGKDGEDVTRPKGYLMRQLGQARGSTDDFTDAYEKDLKPKYLEGLNAYQTDRLSPRLDSYFVSTQNKIITHEANQNDEDFKNSTESNLLQSYADASVIRDPDSLTEAIDLSISNAEPYYSRYDEATRKLKEEEISKNIVQSSTIALLKDTSDLNQAMDLLDSVKDEISIGSYNDIKDKLNTGSKSIKDQLKRFKLDARVLERFDKIDKISDGTLDWDNSEQIIRDVARTDPKLAEAMTNNIKKGGFELESENNQAFMDLSESIFVSGTKEEISDFLVTALNDTKNISRDRLSSLVYAARKRAEEIERKESGGFWKKAWDTIKKTLSVESSAFVWDRVVQRGKVENASDEQIPEIAEEEVDNQNTSDREDVLNTNDIALEQGSPVSFNSVKEAEAANLPVGTEITINGRRAIVE